jgi:predicted nucleotidyltransferase
MNNKLFMSALVGSHNYNLNTETSDKDYKVFVFPTFDDLYYKKEIAKSKTSDYLDYEVHDIRKLSQLWWKANINFIEVLFSQDIRYHIDENNNLVQFIKQNKNELATMNLPYLYDACMGMSLRKQKDMLIDSPARHNNIEKYGYDTKSACHAIRVLDFLVKLAQCDFSFGKAIWYNNSDIKRDSLLSIKRGMYTLEEIKYMIEMCTNNANRIKDVYKQQNPNTKLKEQLDEVIKEQCYEFIKEI